jgi:Short C-terminal domain
VSEKRTRAVDFVWLGTKSHDGFPKAHIAEPAGTDSDARTRMNVLSVLAQIPGLPIPPLPPGFFWLAVTVGGLVFGISRLIESATHRSERGHIQRPSNHSCRYEPPPEDIEVKLRKLASLKDQNLISEEEYHRKRQDIIASW